MMNPQDIRAKTFEKAVFGGYDMAPVDEFLESIAADYEALYKENTVLKTKMKVLVDKIEEYRSTDEAMRMALLSAQKLGSQMTDEAKAKSETLIAEAEAEAAQIREEARSGLADEQARLDEARDRTSKYIESMRALCVKQLEFFDHISDIKASDAIVTPAPAERSALNAAAEETAEAEPVPEAEAAPGNIDDAVKSIEDSVAKLVEEQPEDVKIDPSVLTPEEPTRLFNLGDVLGREESQTEAASAYDFNSFKFTTDDNKDSGSVDFSGFKFDGE